MDDEAIAGTFDSAHEAELARLHLSTHEIEARITDDVVNTMNPLWGQALGGVKVRVRLADAERARALLDKLRKPSPVKLAPTPEAAADAEAARALRAAVFGTFFLPVVAQVYSA